MLPFTGFINTTNNFDFELHTIKQEHDLKLMVINGYNESQKGALGNGSSTAAQFPVSSQKQCYDFKRMFQNQLFA